MITDVNLAVYQMRVNGYTLVEIADALNITDEQVNAISRINNENLDKLEAMENEL